MDGDMPRSVINASSWLGASYHSEVAVQKDKSEVRLLSVTVRTLLNLTWHLKHLRAK